MEFKHAGALMFSNTGLWFKVIAYLLVVILIVCALASAIIIPVFNSINTEKNIDALFDAVKGDVSDFITNGGSLRGLGDNLDAHIGELWQAFIGDADVVAGMVFVLLFLYLLVKFLAVLVQMPIAYIVNNYMSSNMRYGFLSAYAGTFRRSAKFTIAYIICTFPIDCLFGAATFGLGFGLWKLMYWASIPITIFIAIFLLMIRRTIFSGWIPRLLFHPEEKTYKALKNSVKEMKKSKTTLMGGNFVILFITFVIVATFSIPTFGLMTIVAIGFSFLIFRTFELVVYYKQNQMKFYVDPTRIVDTVDYGYRRENQENK